MSAAHQDFVTLVYPSTAEAAMNNTLTIADAMPPRDGVYTFRVIDAIARKGWHLVELDTVATWEDDGCEAERDVVAYILLEGYIPSCQDSWDEPGHAPYFENSRIFVQLTQGEADNPDAFTEIDRDDARYRDLEDAANEYECGVRS